MTYSSGLVNGFGCASDIDRRSSVFSRPQLEKKGVFLAGLKQRVVIVPGVRRARLDRRGAAREGSAAAASSAAGGNTSAIAELLAVAQL